MENQVGWTTNGKRLIFTVTPGRSGTGYLCSLLQGFDVCCLHEPSPNFSDVMANAQTNPLIAEQFLLELKLPFVRDVSEHTYLETSHLACKGFIEPLIDHRIIPDLIILSRDSFSVASSLYQLGTIPGRTGAGLKYLLSPDNGVDLEIGAYDRLHDWALCYWYCLEIERRAKLYKTEVERLGGKTLFTSIDDIRDDEGLTELLDFVFDGSCGTEQYEIINKRREVIVNDKKELKTTPPVPVDEMIKMADEVDRLILTSTNGLNS